MIYSTQVNEAEIEKDFLEVWKKIEENINKYELNRVTQLQVSEKKVNGSKSDQE